jgi:iron complex transport system substrate-binding protein
MNKKFNFLVFSIIIVTLVFAGISGCNQETQTPTSTPASSVPISPVSTTRTIVDMAGRSVELPEKIDRVVSTYPWGSWAMFTLGAQDMLVAVDSQSVKFAQFDRLDPSYKDLPTVGFLNEINSEEILKVNPDFVLCGATESTQIENIGIPAVVIDPGNDCLGSALVTGQAIGEEGKAKELISFYEDTVKMVEERTKDISEDQRQKIFFIHMDKYTTIGNQPYILDMVSSAGGISVTKDLPGSYPKIETEQLLDWNPDVIIVMNGPLKEKSVTVDNILAESAYQGIAAVKNKRVYEEGTYYIYWLHPTVGACLGVLQMAKAMYPDRFEDISVVEKANEFDLKFFGIPYPGDGGNVDAIVTP